MRRKSRYLAGQIALILLALAFSSIIFPHVQSILLNQYEQSSTWAAIMVEIQVAWKAILVSIALIVAMVVMVWKYIEPDDIGDIRVMFKVICRRLGINEEELENERARQKTKKTKQTKNAKN